jgi:hypothetical protein
MSGHTPSSGSRSLLDVYDERDVETYVERLRSGDAAMRALAADDGTDAVSDWGHHSYTGEQAERLSTTLVDALELEVDDVAREAILNALAVLAEADLAPGGEVLRALATARPTSGSAMEHWAALEAWASRWTVRSCRIACARRRTLLPRSGRPICRGADTR